MPADFAEELDSRIAAAELEPELLRMLSTRRYSLNDLSSVFNEVTEAVARGAANEVLVREHRDRVARFIPAWMEYARQVGWIDGGVAVDVLGRPLAPEWWLTEVGPSGSVELRIHRL